MLFVEKLIQSIKEKKSVVCMGLDPRMEQEEQIPQFLIEQYDNSNEIILEFNKRLIENTDDLIPIIKPNIAFYERYDALSALKKTIKYAHKHDILVLLDAKRNDIGSTSEAYASANFEVYDADACTVNAYFGIDGINPFLQYKEKGTFILVKTSNPSSKEFQDLFSAKLKGVKSPEIKKQNISDVSKLRRNYIQMALLVKKWGNQLDIYQNYHNLGAVVGATYPNELKRIRTILDHSYILIPGYGAQGATAKDIKYGFDRNGLGAIVNSSRRIMFAYNKTKEYSAEKFGEAARQEIEKMNAAINKEIKI
jgi:orotidine-5'-phosphate decarboxylase